MPQTRLVCLISAVYALGAMAMPSTAFHPDEADARDVTATEDERSSEIHVARRVASTPTPRSVVSNTTDAFPAPSGSVAAVADTRSSTTTAVPTTVTAITTLAPDDAQAAFGPDPGVGPPSPPSGVAAPVGDLPGWNQLFVDDFDTDVALGKFPDAVSDKWTAYPSPWTDTTTNGTYSPERVVSVRDGVLNKNIHTADGRPRVAAVRPRVPGSASFGTLYGRYEVRFRIDRHMPGYKVAWLLWPDSGTHTTGSSTGIGGNGEIDFPETDLDSASVSGFVHHQDAVVGSDQVGYNVEIDVREWHTYTIEWSPDLVVLLVDAVEIGRTTERVPATPMHWVLQTETSLDAIPMDDTAGNVQVDWVAMWAYDAPDGMIHGSDSVATVENEQA